MPKCFGLRLLSLDALLPLALLVAVLSVFAHRHSVLLEGVASAPRRHTLRVRGARAGAGWLVGEMPELEWL